MPVRRPSALAASGAILMAAGALAVAAAAVELGDPSLRRSGEERAVNLGAGDLGDIDAHNSPSLAVHPRDPQRLVVGTRIDTPRFSCAVHASRDGGRTWRAARVPIPRGEEPKCYAPDVAFSADGRLHVSYVTLRGVGNVPHAVWLTSSSDGGRTLGRPRRISGPRAFQVRLAADPADARRLHLTWLQAEEVGPLRFTTVGNPVVAARSQDGGRTWSRPERVSAPDRARVLAPTPAVAPGGELYVLFLDVGDDRLDYAGGHDGFGGPPYAGRHTLVLARSRDGGRRWEESVVDAAIRPIERFVAFLPAFPALAVDHRSGRVLAGYHDRRHGDADVLVWALDRGAGAWRGPVRVNDTRRRDGTTQRLPQLAVAPGGRVDVVYHDRRADRADVRTEVSLQSSFDGARSFGGRVVLTTQAFDARIGFGSERGLPDLGSRIAVASTDERVMAVWADTRSGTDASNKQDVLLGVAEAQPWPGDRRDLLLRVGLALLAGGVAATALAVRRRRPR